MVDVVRNEKENRERPYPAIKGSCPPLMFSGWFTGRLMPGTHPNACKHFFMIIGCSPCSSQPGHLFHAGVMQNQRAKRRGQGKQAST
eukprot:591228-Pelagomonas_calceolata.AAC.4